MEQYFAEFGLLAVAFFLAIDDFGVPIPISTLIFAVSVWIKTNPDMSLIPLICIAVFIPPICNNILFLWGRHGARKWLQTHGHKFFLPDRRLKKAEKFFKDHGPWAIFLGSCFTTLRPMLAVTAGSTNMHHYTFIISNFLGVCIWAGVVIGSGYYFGESIWYVVKNNWEIAFGILCFLVVAKILFWEYWNGRNENKK